MRVPQSKHGGHLRIPAWPLCELYIVDRYERPRLIPEFERPPQFSPLPQGGGLDRLGSGEGDLRQCDARGPDERPDRRVPGQGAHADHDALAFEGKLGRSDRYAVVRNRELHNSPNP